MINPKKLEVIFLFFFFLLISNKDHASSVFSEAKANGNVFGVALAQCVLDDDSRFQDESNFIASISPTTPTASASSSGAVAAAAASAPPVAASGINRKDSTDFVGVAGNDKRTSPSGSISSTNDSGYSISPASPSSLHVRR